MLLSEVCALIENERQLEDSTKEQYRRCARNFSDFIGYPASVSDLSEQRVNLWLTNLERLNKDPVTVRGYKRGLLVIWNSAAAANLCECYARPRLRKIKKVQKPVFALSVSQVRDIERSASELRGTIDSLGMAASTYATAYVAVAMDTLFRPVDMRLLKWASISGAVISISQHKTGVAICRPLRNSTIDFLSVLKKSTRSHGPGDLVFPLAKWTWRFWEERILEDAGINVPRVGLGHLRHAGATQITKIHGLEAATKTLGHVPGSRMAAIHYVATDVTSSGPLAW